MNESQRKLLLQVARRAIEAAVRGRSIPPVPETDDPELKEKCGCFVTIKKHGQLRGCIGNFISDKPLIELVSDMAVSAALHDPRFVYNRLRPDELGEIDIEVSVLSPLQRTTDPLSLELGKHGIYIKRGFAAGCFLPQVATETGWDKETFLSQCCAGKAGLPPDAWRDPQTEVYLFTAEVFGEHEQGAE